MWALLSGVEQRLRSAAVLNDNPTGALGTGAICGVQPDGKPPGFSGQMYYAISSGGERDIDDNAQGLDRYYGVVVTITVRMGYAPRDRRGAQITTPAQLLDQADMVAAALNQDDIHRISANTLIPNTAEWVAVNGGTVTKNGFIEPLRAGPIGKVIKAPPDWTDSSVKTDVYYVEVTLKEARRVQYIGS